LRLDRFIGEVLPDPPRQARAHLISVIGGDTQVSAICAAISMGERFMVNGLGVPPIRVCLERNAQCSTKTLAERSKETDSDENVVASVEFVIRTELHDSAETDFVHSILGRIIAEPENRGKQDAGHIGASLVQFAEALDHGISAERLGDGISGDISEYWEHLFDVETGYP
jgi:hypothetical protein